MVDSPTIDDARIARDDAIHQISETANPEWTGLMYRIGIALARQLPFFSTNDMFDILDQLKQVPPIHDRRALGHVMQELHRTGVCVPTFRFQASRRRHCAPLRIWQSCIYVAPLLALPAR